MKTGRFPDEMQQRVIAHQSGNCLVLAPAGSGKTRVMTERLAGALERGVDPAATLCVTFTNRAAREISQRVSQRIPDCAKHVRIGTFHGLCARILRSEAKAASLPQDFVIYDEIDALEIMRQVSRCDEKTARGIMFRLADAKSRVSADRLSLGSPPADLLSAGECDVVRQYHDVLANQHALDFADLVYRTRALLRIDSAASARWTGRFRWIQLDEVQDTHLSEFDILTILGSGCSAIALFGDLDQTIYEWRGSDPAGVLAAFTKSFGPVTRFELTYNYRATRALLETAERFKQSFSQKTTRLAPAPDLPDGRHPIVLTGTTPEDEAGNIARDCRGRTQGTDRIGVLTRTNELAGIISRVFDEHAIPHITVEQFEFFRRQEIKDAIARLRLLLTPSDEFATRRVLLRPASGVGEATIRRIVESTDDTKLRLSDFLSLDTHEYGDPYGRLLEAWRKSAVVVFDVESTGLDVERDEVIEIAALRRTHTGAIHTFHRYISPSRPVGESERIHGHSDDFLRAHGENAAAVFCDLQRFIGDAPVVGHNVGYDAWIVQSHARRAGVSLELSFTFDTLDITRRLWKLERYDLSTVSTLLELPTPPTHRALDDARATLDVLGKSIPELTQSAAARSSLVEENGQLFLALARRFDGWRRKSAQTRPGPLLSEILCDSGLAEHYAHDARRTGHLRDLVGYFIRSDEPEADPRELLARLTWNAALARNVDHLDPEDRRVLVLTIHQAKGLEFDGVYIAGTAEGQIPSYFAVRDGKIEEERRLFYVALTRPKAWLSVSWSQVNARGFRVQPSRFLRDAGLS